MTISITTANATTKRITDLTITAAAGSISVASNANNKARDATVVVVVVAAANSTTIATSCFFYC